MDNVLLVSSSQKGIDYFTKLLSIAQVSRITSVSDGGKARRMLLEQDFDLVIINTPLSDEFGHELALHISQYALGVLLIVKSELVETVSIQVASTGVFILAKPLNQPIFYQSFKLIATAQQKFKCLQQENQKLHRKLNELQLISRAKCLLIEQQQMTEQQAHKQIEQQAMNLRITRREVAEDIIQQYQL